MYLNKDESLRVEEAISVLQKAIEHLQWFKAVDLYDNEMKKREATLIYDEISVAADLIDPAS